MDLYKDETNLNYTDAPIEEHVDFLACQDLQPARSAGCQAAGGFPGSPHPPATDVLCSDERDGQISGPRYTALPAAAKVNISLNNISSQTFLTKLTNRVQLLNIPRFCLFTPNKNSRVFAMNQCNTEIKHF